ncbi:hypothetical protein ACFC3F_00360 [Microbacterium sp. NPDC055910]|uniref:DUF6414 family protein n=1 Tax=Microbacterium sp. NPDC055910 TaxID=3345659 RepID=UPI0035E34FFE
MGWLWWRRAIQPAIREFVYLDEVSVESLLASVDGEILVESTRTSSRSTEVGVSATTADGLFEQASFSPSLKSVRGRQVQELRKSVAQSAFARFRQRNMSRFAIHGLDPAELSQRQREAIARRESKALRRWKQGIPVADVRRGDLFEIESDVSAADIFRVRTAMVAVTDVMEAYPTFLSLEQREIFKTTRPLTDLIDKLNGDAIPVVGHRPNLTIEEIEGVQWLVAAPPRDGIVIESVVQPQWFWGDPGRTLFQDHRFRILCRVVSPSLSARPASSYVGTILRTINDELAATVDALGPMFLGALRTGHQRGKQNRPPSYELFDWYVTAMSAHVDPTVDANSIATVRDSFDVAVERLSLVEQTQLFRSIDQAIFSGAANVLDDVKASLRDSARTRFALWPWSSGSTSVTEPLEESGKSQFLEVEIIAAYW